MTRPTLRKNDVSACDVRDLARKYTSLTKTYPLSRESDEEIQKGSIQKRQHTNLTRKEIWCPSLDAVMPLRRRALRPPCRVHVPSHLMVSALIRFVCPKSKRYARNGKDGVIIRLKFLDKCIKPLNHCILSHRLCISQP